MDVVDRVSATDRAVAAYRRFVDADSLDVVPDMISDLLHWYRIMLDVRVSVDTLRGILDSALDQYTSELERFGIGDDPLTGNRRNSNIPRRGRDFEPVYAPGSQYPSPSGETSAFDMPMPESALLDNAPDHPGYATDESCNCLECMSARAENRGWAFTGSEWVPQAVYNAMQSLEQMASIRFEPDTNEEDDLEF
jgi:hypothetical protein